jgi:hypothetical protein
MHSQLWSQRIEQVVHHATKLNGAISVARGVPVARAHITYGGYYGGIWGRNPSCSPVSIVVSKQVYRMFYIHRVVSIFYTLKICDLCVDNRFQWILYISEIPVEEPLVKCWFLVRVITALAESLYWDWPK